MTTARIAILLLPLMAVACDSSKSPAGHGAAQANQVEANMAAVTETPAVPGDRDTGAQAGNNADKAFAPADWVGRWNGPEGLFLDIKPSPSGKTGSFALTLKDNLDSQAAYEGMAADGAIRFQRGGKIETIRLGTGAETGFKDLLERPTCLIVQTGKEGYCR
ncbi:hypothetical protein BH10PSE12_BH10PSE12_17160 [soil metagenome]